MIKVMSGTKMIIENGIALARDLISSAVEKMQRDNPEYRDSIAQLLPQIAQQYEKFKTMPPEKILAVRFEVLYDTVADGVESYGVDTALLGTNEIFGGMTELAKFQNMLDSYNKRKDNCMCEACQLRRKAEAGEEITKEDVDRLMRIKHPILN